MKIADIEQQLIQAGCKSVHIERFWRNWYSGKPLNRSKVRLPAAAEAILPQMEEYLANQLTAQEKAESETGTRWVLKAYDGQLIECVLLPREGVCVSTQVGCAVGCVFCMTGKSGLIRQLTDLEVAGQVQYAMRNAPVKKVVLMGMGEPSHNLRSVFSAVEHIVRYSGIGYKEVVISTVGDKRLFKALMESQIKPALAISLHSAMDEKRRSLLPRAAELTVKEILEFGAKYAEVGKYPIQYQWTLINGVNDGVDEIEALAPLWSRQAILNMIPVNAVEGSPYKRPSAEQIERIKEACRANGILLKFRDSAAQDVDGGCGQLRARALKRKPAIQPAQELKDFNAKVLADKSLGNQNVIDAKAAIPSESHHSIVPPGIGFFRLFKSAEGIR